MTSMCAPRHDKYLLESMTLHKVYHRCRSIYAACPLAVAMGGNIRALFVSLGTMNMGGCVYNIVFGQWHRGMEEESMQNWL